MAHRYFGHWEEISHEIATIHSRMRKMSETIAQLQAQDTQFMAAIDANTAAVQQAIMAYQGAEATLATALAALQTAENNQEVVPANVVSDFAAGFAKLQASTAALTAAFNPPATSTTSGGTDTVTSSGGSTLASPTPIVTSGGTVVSGGTLDPNATVTNGGSVTSS